VNVDNRTSIRRRSLRGPAAAAAQARMALGLSAVPERHLTGADLPVPLMHGAAGVAVCALATLARPQALGIVFSAVVTALLCVLIGAGLTIYDRNVFAPSLRPSRASIALPMAAVIAYVVVLGATDLILLRLAAAGLATALIAAIPYIESAELTGRKWPIVRLVRDAASVMVLLPCIVAAVSEDEPLGTRVVVGLVATALVTLDGLRMENLPRQKFLWGAAVTAVVTTAVALIPGGASSGLRAGLVLMVWYGVRGAALTFAAGRRGVTLILEYIAVVMVAGIAIFSVHG
jgi:hypothetical protein